ncbi:MAG: PIN domain-containing protein [Prevotellaceae bacterium]|nr:PIN domain-containing protein [Prevotellaceae bacterium]
MKDRVFIDTNVLIYLYSEDELTKRMVAVNVLEQFHCLTSTQTLNEFCSVCLRKLKIPGKTVWNSIKEIIDECELCYINTEIVGKALTLNDKYGYAYYDCLILASALFNDCNYLFSEDMQNGQIIEGVLTIKNPFI